MKINFTKSLFVLTLALSATSGLFAQATVTSTTFSGAVTSGAQTVQVASATGITAQQLGAFTTELFVDQELIGVISVSGTTLTVQRGVLGTRQTAHATAATVWVGPPSYFSVNVQDPNGACTAANEIALPRFFLATGDGYTCPTTGPRKGQWTLQYPVNAAVLRAATDLYGAPAGASVCHATYSFAADGGATGIITPKSNCVIPKNALVFRSLVYSEATPVGSTGNVSVGTTAGSSATSILAATARASLATGDIFDGASVPTTASTQNTTYFVMTAAGSIDITVASNALTAGILDIYVWFIALPV